MSEFKSSNFRNEDGSGGPDIVGLTTFTSPYYFVPPSGTTAERPSDPAPGMLRFNEDIGRLEVWRNDHWATILGEQSATLGGRGLWGGGYSPGSSNTVDYVTIQSTGNAVDFGDLTQARSLLSACSSSVRGVFAGGRQSGTLYNIIDYVTIATLGDAVNFGDLLNPVFQNTGCSNAVRGLFGGGYVTPASTNRIEFITISSTGDSTDFGDLSYSENATFATSSRTRGLFAGGGSFINTINYVTIESTGNGVDFGDLTLGRQAAATCSSSVRALFAGGLSSVPASNTKTNTIDYVTISTLGNAQDFGDLTLARGFYGGGCSDATRGVFGGGYGLPSPATTHNNIDFVTISTTGNAQDFGDFPGYVRHRAGTCSNAHGGL